MQPNMGSACLPSDKGFYLDISFLSIRNVLKLSNNFHANSEYVEWDLLDGWILQTICNYQNGAEGTVDLQHWKYALINILGYVIL